ncbi:TLC domain-containing protein, partial [Jimgerdemannia flammicorona]
MSLLQSVFESVGLPALTHHWHILLLSTFACNLIFQFSVALSPILFPKTYPQLKGFKRVNWDIHVVSMAHCIVIILGAVPMLWDPALSKDKVFGYSPWAGNVFAIACGYFLWDTCTSIKYIKQQGAGFVFHGVSSFSVYIFSYRPFLNYYGAPFLMFELSTPFLNINWFMDKLGMTGSIAQLINGFFLLSTFFFARLVFGFYMSFQTYREFSESSLDVLAVIDRVPMFRKQISPTSFGCAHLLFPQAPQPNPFPLRTLTVCIIYGLANVVLSLLNTYWFWQMVKSLARRFQPAPKPKSTDEAQGLLLEDDRSSDLSVNASDGLARRPSASSDGHANGVEASLALTEGQLLEVCGEALGRYRPTQFASTEQRADLPSCEMGGGANVYTLCELEKTLMDRIGEYMGKVVAGGTGRTRPLQFVGSKTQTGLRQPPAPESFK